jgi:hypothetical protein
MSPQSNPNVCGAAILWADSNQSKVGLREGFVTVENV